jgi:DNA-binding Lrp family transcriptional regulator
VKGVDEVQSELALEVLRFQSMWALLSAPQRHLPPSPLKDVVDELDLSIIGLLQQDARSSNRGIAAELDVSEGTVRTRIRRMEEEGLIRIQAISDVVAFGFTAHAYVGIKVDGGRIDDVAAALLASDAIAVLVRSLGEYDFVAVVVAADRQALEDIILNQVGDIAGVRRTETFESWRTLKHSYNWARLVA